MDRGTASEDLIVRLRDIDRHHGHPMAGECRAEDGQAIVEATNPCSKSADGGTHTGAPFSAIPPNRRPFS